MTEGMKWIAAAGADTKEAERRIRILNYMSLPVRPLPTPPVFATYFEAATYAHHFNLRVRLVERTETSATYTVVPLGVPS